MNEPTEASCGLPGRHTPADILDELGLLPIESETGEPIAGVRDDERRADRRVPTTGSLRVMMLAGNRPLGQPFVVSGMDISRGGVRLGGNAPLLLGSRLVIELKRSDGVQGLLAGTVCHSTFGDPTVMRDDNACTAGLRFSSIDQTLVNDHFTDATGRVSLDVFGEGDEGAG